MKFWGYKYLATRMVIMLSSLVTWSSTDATTLKLTSGWKRLSEGMAPGPRSGSSVWTDKSGRAWLFGGRAPTAAIASNDSTRLSADLWSYDIRFGRWSHRVPGGHVALLPSSSSHAEADVGFSAPVGRELSAMCGITDGNLVIFGGRTSDNDVTDQMLIWHPQLLPVQFETRVCGLELDDRGQSCPPPRYDALHWCDDDYMTVVGGIDADGRLLSDAWRLDLQRLTWTRLMIPASGCLWTLQENVTTHLDSRLVEIHNNTTNGTNELLVEQSSEDDLENPNVAMTLAWSSPVSGVHILCEHNTVAATTTTTMRSRDNDLQLWHQVSQDSWTLIGESGSRNSTTTWPGIRLHAAACTDATAGNLWLFGGESRIATRTYVDNDVWTYDVVSGTWIKPEIPVSVLVAGDVGSSGSITMEPQQRQLSAAWCHKDVMYVYGGIGEHGHIYGDLWQLDIGNGPTATPRPPSTTLLPPPPPPPIPQTNTKQSSFAVANGSSSSSAAIKHQVEDYVNLSTLRRRLPSLNDGSSSSSASSDGVGFGSAAIFFGISLSIFTIFGVVLFFRRCVSCPPHDGIVLKEPPPVRYTVIPDETSYTI